jgi:hypothetical protein
MDLLTTGVMRIITIRGIRLTMAHGRTTTGTGMSAGTGITRGTGKIGGRNTGIGTITVPITRSVNPEI